MKANQWKEWIQLSSPRVDASAIQINATHTLIFGGHDGNYQYDGKFDFKWSEMVSSNGVSKSIDLPMTITHPCTLKINSTMALIAGGYQDSLESPETYYLNLETLDITSGPRMQSERIGHGCVTFYLGGKTYGLVAGGADSMNELNSTEILDLEQTNPSWTDGKKH